MKPDDTSSQYMERGQQLEAHLLPILIDECTRDGKLKKGDLAMLLALGAGLNWGTALVRL